MNDAFWNAIMTRELSEELHRITQTDASLIRLAFRARKKLGLHGVTELRNAVGNVSRQLIYRTLSKKELMMLNDRHEASCLHNDCWCRPGSDGT